VERDQSEDLGVDETTILERVEPLLCNDGEIIKYSRDVSRQRLGKHVPAVTDTRATIEVLLEIMFYTWSVQRGYKEDKLSNNSYPCGGGVEYPHRSPASGRRRRKGNPVPGGISVPPCSYAI
jgi:DNA-binding Lrp family transcriptional regulator